MTKPAIGRPIEILLVEDNEGDARLAQEAQVSAEVANNLFSVNDDVKTIEESRTIVELPLDGRVH